MSIWMIVVGAILLLLYVGINYYIDFRMYQIAHEYLPRVFCNILIGILVVCSIVLVLRFVLVFVPEWKIIKQVVNWISSYWMGVFVYLFLFFILADILLGLGKLTGIVSSPVPYSVRIYANIIAVCISIVMIGYGIYHASKIETVSYEIQVSEKNETDDLHIVLISDLHLGAVTSEQKFEEVVDNINQMKPDVICIAGDIFDSDFGTIQNQEKTATNLKKLNARFGVYCCLGNHDAGTSFSQMEEFLEKCNIRCLNEEYVNIDNQMTLLGRVDSSPIGSQGRHSRIDTEVLLNSIEAQLPIVVMDHNPANLSQYPAKTDLILCGHTHHGQIWPANYVTAYGYYPAKDSTPQAIITSGCGVWGMPMRVSSSCEIVSIKLKL